MSLCSYFVEYAASKCLHLVVSISPFHIHASQDATHFHPGHKAEQVTYIFFITKF